MVQLLGHSHSGYYFQYQYNMATLTAVLFTLWVVSVVSFISINTYQRWKQGRRAARLLAEFNGPWFRIPFVGDLYRFMGNPDDVLKKGCDIVKWYGPSRIRLWLCHFPIIITADPDDIEIILGNQLHSSKPYYFYRIIECFFGQGLIVLNGDEWRAHRKAMTPSFHFSVLERYSNIFLERADILCKRLMQYCGGPEIDIRYPVSETSFETVCETVFGCPATSQSEAERESFIRDMESAYQIMQYRAIHPWLMNDWLFSMTSMGRKHRIADEKVRHYAYTVIKTRKLALVTEKQADQDDDGIGARQRYSFLDLMLKGNNDLSEEAIWGELRTLIAVQETSANTLCFALEMLAMHQDIQAQVLDEIRSVWSQPALTSHQRLQALTLLDRVLKETLRLFPAVPLIGREATCDIELSDGKVVPSGSIVAPCIYILHRDPKYFPDPLIFDPDRFLPENCAGRHPYAYVPFSAGARNCIGQKYGMLQMKAVLSSLVRHFLVLPGKAAPTKVADVRLTTDTLLKRVGGSRVRIVDRAVLSA